MTYCLTETAGISPFRAAELVMPRQWILVLLGIGAGVLLAACASVSVEPLPTDVEVKLGRAPLKILVQNFTFPEADLKVDREGGDLDAFKKQLSEELGYDIVDQVVAQKLVPNAEVIYDAVVPPQRAWLVTGQFVRAEQGSRALRALIGFGTGGTKFETIVEVYDLDSPTPKEPIFTFSTTGGSGAAPGAVISATPYTFAASAATGSMAGLSSDSRRTARMIVSYLSEQLWMDNDLSSDQEQPAKRLGSWAEFDMAPDSDNPKPKPPPGRNGSAVSSKQ